MPRPFPRREITVTRRLRGHCQVALLRPRDGQRPRSRACWRRRIRSIGGDRPEADLPHDVRELLDNADGTQLFDKGSFTETLAGWGKTVVAGRAKLGGILASFPWKRGRSRR